MACSRPCAASFRLAAPTAKRWRMSSVHADGEPPETEHSRGTGSCGVRSVLFPSLSKLQKLRCREHTSFPVAETPTPRTSGRESATNVGAAPTRLAAGRRPKRWPGESVAQPNLARAFPPLAQRANLTPFVPHGRSPTSGTRRRSRSRGLPPARRFRPSRRCPRLRPPPRWEARERGRAPAQLARRCATRCSLTRSTRISSTKRGATWPACSAA